jgi:hypothetical protein
VLPVIANGGRESVFLVGRQREARRSRPRTVAMTIAAIAAAGGGPRMEWYEHFCPDHGVVLRYRRDDVAPVIPITCPEDVAGPRLRCGERLKLRIVPTQPGLHLERRPPTGW